MDATSSAAVIVEISSFMTNIFRGSKNLSAFKLARGYAPLILGISRQMISQELLDVHTERETTRAIERIMRANEPKLIDHEQLKKGEKVLVYHKSSKQNELNVWLEAKVESSERNMVMCKRSRKGKAMSVAYEDVRILPKGELTQELMRPEAAVETQDDH